MGIFHTESNKGAKVVSCSIRRLPEKLHELDSDPTFIIAYVSPYLDLEQVGAMVLHRFPDIPLAMCSTAGELHATSDSLYCTTGNYWDRIVLQCFDSSIISKAEIVSIPLDCEDIRQARLDISMEERIQRLKKRILQLNISMEIDYRNTLAYILFDGLSSSESFFMEALYESSRFPCIFVGGSAGGKSDFQNTWIFDGEKALANHAVIAFLKMAPNARFSIMKSQNFTPVGTSFSILSASVEFRTVSQVIDRQGNIISLINALCDLFHCPPTKLDSHMQEYSFAIQVGNELFVRSIRTIDIEGDLVHFYCDISPGEELLLVRKKALRECTISDFAAFMEGKPSPPVAGILNDCILRRLLNGGELSHMGAILSGTAIAGFSTFGEILGLYLNQTLTAIFFFHVPEGCTFKNDYIDNFTFYYAEFKSFFLKRQITKLKGLSHIVVRQIEDFKQHKYGKRLESCGLESFMTTVFEGLNSLGQELSNADVKQRLQTRQIEQQLQQSEEWFRLLAESSLAGIYHMEDNRFDYVNGSFATMFGYTVEEIINETSINDLIAPEHRQLVAHKIRQRETGEKQTLRYSFRALRKNGSTFFVEVHGRRINHRGKVGIIGTLIDITEQKRAEANLRASEERYRAFYNETPSMFFTVDAQGIIITVNDFGAHQLGFRKNELEGNYFLNIFHQDDQDSVQKQIITSLQKIDQINHWQFRKIRKDGSAMWCEEFVRTIHGPEEKITLLIVSQDITARKRLEESLRLTQYVFDKAPVGIFVMDEHGSPLDVNEYACSSLGYSKEELCQLTVHDWDPNFDAEAYAHLIQQMNTIQSQTFETIHLRKDKETFPVQIYISSLDYDNKQLQVAFTHDISDWKQAKEEQKHLESQLKQIQKMEAIGRLAGGIAHDLNNLLTPVLGYSELLQLDASIDTKAKDKLNQIGKAATGAKDLVRQLLAFSRKQVMEYHPLDLNSVLKDFANLMRRTVQENIDIAISTSHDIPPILADQGQIEQVLLNLVVNASDAMPKGGRLEIETQMTELTDASLHTYPDLKPGFYIILLIRDSGTGMDEKTMANIFEPFYSTKGDLGTGLGLATVYGIVKQHNGSIIVTSKPGKGTTFKVFLPATERGLHAMDYKEKQRFDIYGTETILLVEDNEAVRSTVHDILIEKGYKVITAANGEEAILLITQNKKIDMLITDVVMSGMNGKELFSKIQTEVPNAKVLYISGYTDDIIIRHDVDNEQVQFLQKPFSTIGLLQKVKEVLRT